MIKVTKIFEIIGHKNVKGGVAEFEVNLKIYSTHGVFIIRKKIWSRSPVVRKTPLFPLGKPQKSNIWGNLKKVTFWGNLKKVTFCLAESVQPFLNGTKNIVLLQ